MVFHYVNTPQFIYQLPFWYLNCIKSSDSIHILTHVRGHQLPLGCVEGSRVSGLRRVNFYRQ